MLVRQLVLKHFNWFRDSMDPKMGAVFFSSGAHVDPFFYYIGCEPDRFFSKSLVGL